MNHHYCYLLEDMKVMFNINSTLHGTKSHSCDFWTAHFSFLESRCASYANLSPNFNLLSQTFFRKNETLSNERNGLLEWHPKDMVHYLVLVLTLEINHYLNSCFEKGEDFGLYLPRRVIWRIHVGGLPILA